MDGQIGALEDLQYFSAENFQDKKDRIKNWRGEVLTETDLKDCLIPLTIGNSRQIEHMKELQFLYDCREFGKPEYSLEVVSL